MSHMGQNVFRLAEPMFWRETLAVPGCAAYQTQGYMMNEQRPGDGGKDESTYEEIWLLGQPPLGDYLDFVRDTGVDGANADPAALADEWRVANDYYHELEEREAGIADLVECRELDPALAPLVAEVEADARYRHAFDTLPTSFGMVELDRLVLFQQHVTRQFVNALKSRLGPAPDPETVFRFCLPLRHPDTPVRVQRVGSRRYVFCSESSDLRFHEPALFRPDQIRDHKTSGPISGIVGVVIGFGSNFLNVIRDDNRLVLQNGYHRACALRELGITHAPCIIETVTRLDELNVAAHRDVVRNPAFYFKAARPPLLKDFFDSKIRKTVRTRKILRMIEIEVDVREFEILE